MAGITGSLIEDPLFRYKIRLTRRGDVLRGEFWVEPGGGGLIEHLHPPLEERFEILDGEVTAHIDGRKQNARAGERITVGAGVPHRFKNTGDSQAHLVVDMQPALQMGELFRDAAVLARQRKWIRVGRRGIPTGPLALLDLAEFLDRYREIFVPTSPPPAVQRIGVPALARIARRRRRSAT